MLLVQVILFNNMKLKNNSYTRTSFILRQRKVWWRTIGKPYKIYARHWISEVKTFIYLVLIGSNKPKFLKQRDTFIYSFINVNVHSHLQAFELHGIWPCFKWPNNTGLNMISCSFDRTKNPFTIVKVFSGDWTNDFFLY